MDDRQILQLFQARDEQAIKETQIKYGAFCHSIAYSVLRDRQDAEECVNDTYLEAWNTIPPHCPNPLSGFLGMLTRRISLDRYRRKHAQKRGGDTVCLAYDELEDCIPDRTQSLQADLTARELGRLLSDFLRALPETECNVFLRRYWFFDSVEEISRRYGFGQSKVKMMLSRTRAKLKKRLEKEEIFL